MTDALVKYLTQKIPRHHLQKLAHFGLRLISPFYRGNRFEDPISGITYRKLLPYGRIISRKNALAPDTLSLERHRLLWLFLKKKTNLFTAKLKFLHVAPEFCYLKIFRNAKNLQYVTGDLNSPWADVKMDVHKIPFENNTFDVVMANHLLEHVENDIKVMAEFFRILKPGVWAIFMVPIDMTKETTFEDSSIKDPKEREKLFWQSDHIRLYGLDFPKRAASVGFSVTVEKFAETLSEEEIIRYAVNKDEIIYYCTKS